MAEIFWQRAGKNCFTLHANYMLLYSICFPSAAHLLRNCTLHFLAFCLSVASCSKSAIIVADSVACASWSAALTFSVCCECRCLYRMVLKPIEAIVQSCLVEYLDFRWLFYKFRHRGITVQCLKCTMSISWAVVALPHLPLSPNFQSLSLSLRPRPCATACWPCAFSPPALRVQFQFLAFSVMWVQHISTGEK